jgi:hypothetical protein
MEITFLKDHLGHTAGDSVTVTTDQGNYFIRCNVAEEANGKAEVKKPAVVNTPKAPAPKKPRPSRAKPKPAPVAPVVDTKKDDEEFDL